MRREAPGGFGLGSSDPWLAGVEWGPKKHRSKRKDRDIPYTHPLIMKPNKVGISL